MKISIVYYGIAAGVVAALLAIGGHASYFHTANMVARIMPCNVGIGARIVYTNKYGSGSGGGSGSGVIIDAKNGYIVTNEHVTAAGNEYTVMLSDGRKVSAKLVGGDMPSDIAVLQIADPVYCEATFAEDIDIGDSAVAIGMPYGLFQSVSKGIISAKGRPPHNKGLYKYFLQMDTAINPGNSGGGVWDQWGELIGIASNGIQISGASVNINFAIPSFMVRALADQIIEHGDVKRGELGITASTITDETAGNWNGVIGVLVDSVAEGSAAELYGLDRGDVVLEVDGHTVVSVWDMANRLGLIRAGEIIRLKIIKYGVVRRWNVIAEEPEEEDNTGR
jgi:S1-C subfamily serine protease